MLLILLKEYLQRTERLSLIPNLIDNSVEGCQVGRVFHVCKDFFLAYFLINLVEVANLKQIKEELWVALASNKNADDLSVVA